MVGSNALHFPTNTTCFQIERSPIPLRIEGSVANIGHKSHETVCLLLLKCSITHIGSGVEVRQERKGAALYGIPIDWLSGGRSASKPRTAAAMARVNNSWKSFLGRAVIGRTRLDVSRRYVSECENQPRDSDAVSNHGTWI